MKTLLIKEFFENFFLNNSKLKRFLMMKNYNFQFALENTIKSIDIN